MARGVRTALRIRRMHFGLADGALASTARAAASMASPALAIFTERAEGELVDAKKISISVGKDQLATAKRIAKREGLSLLSSRLGEAQT